MKVRGFHFMFLHFTASNIPRSILSYSLQLLFLAPKLHPMLAYISTKLRIHKWGTSGQKLEFSICSKVQQSGFRGNELLTKNSMLLNTEIQMKNLPRNLERKPRRQLWIELTEKLTPLDRLQRENHIFDWKIRTSKESWLLWVYIDENEQKRKQMN